MNRHIMVHPGSTINSLLYGYLQYVRLVCGTALSLTCFMIHILYDVCTPSMGSVVHSLRGRFSYGIYTIAFAVCELVILWLTCVKVAGFSCPVGSEINLTHMMAMVYRPLDYLSVLE